MRLLMTRQYELIEAHDIPAPFPQYAILSHTWISPKDEITYQDFKQRKGDIENDIFKQKGWAKLKKYCNRAARDGWEWAWMDTCCIDKTNPADTQEAINAMFRWYQSASICYAYLDDVDVHKAAGRLVPVDCDLDDIASSGNVADAETASHQPLKDALKKANWFTRGWTLQELLAPPYLVFVDQAWRRIGTRESWYGEIKEASRIEARHLTNFSPTDFKSCSIAMRLSWASDRKTTVEEDETYSLLGLFGISLPLIYGEGRWRAFNRLQRQLITFYNDDSIFAWKFKSSMSGQSAGSQRNAYQHGTGILAPSIREYWDASTIKAFGFYDNSFSMTNKGLEINAKRWRHKFDASRCLVRLNCGPAVSNRPGVSNRLAIPLKQVNDAYDRIQLDEIYNMDVIELGDWREEPSNEPTVIRASNYADVVTSSSIFILDCLGQITIGNKYFVDFDKPAISRRLRLLDGSFSSQGLAKNELIVEPNRLVFINIETQSEGSNFQLDVIINLNRRSFPSVGVLSRAQDRRERLGDPLGQASGSYEALAEHLHTLVEDQPAYPVVAADKDADEIVSVLLLPQPRQRRGAPGSAEEENLATSREYLLKIKVQQGSDHERSIQEHPNKKRKFG